MPYKLSSKATQIVDTGRGFPEDLTDLQEKALMYYDIFRNQGYIGSSEVAQFYDLAPQAMRGPTHHLYKRGLLDKEEESPPKPRQNWNLLPARDDEVKLVDEIINFGTGPETVQVFYPKNKLISKAQRERAEREYELRRQ